MTKFSSLRANECGRLLSAGEFVFVCGATAAVASIEQQFYK